MLVDITLGNTAIPLIDCLLLSPGVYSTLEALPADAARRLRTGTRAPVRRRLNVPPAAPRALRPFFGRARRGVRPRRFFINPLASSISRPCCVDAARHPAAGSTQAGPSAFRRTRN
jgi:hypothetical protein